jgi:hypothetical protein
MTIYPLSYPKLGQKYLNNNKTREAFKRFEIDFSKI